jgi:hypothetical protein
MNAPVKTFGNYVVCFEAETEDLSARHHFIKECGWTEAQYRRIKDYAWFSARVSIWRDGVELGDQYLGACCYRDQREFYTRYEGDYFADMVWEIAKKIAADHPTLLSLVEPWHAAHGEASRKHHDRMMAKAAAKAAAKATTH